jgi:ketosteroid isomerase-like protein
VAFSGPLEDRVAIRELMDTYADAVSRIDAEAWAACWVDDGAVWSIPFYPQIGTIEGKEKMLAIWVEAMKTFAGDNFVMTPGSIEVLGDRAKVTAYTSEAYDIGNTIFRDRGYYEDLCVKIDGRWYFKERTFHLRHRQTFEIKPEDREFTHR